MSAAQILADLADGGGEQHEPTANNFPGDLVGAPPSFRWSSWHKTIDAHVNNTTD